MTVHFLPTAGADAVDASAMDLLRRSRHRDPSADINGGDVRDAALLAVCNEQDSEAIELWRWLVRQGDRADFLASAFVTAIDAAAQHRECRASVHGYAKGEFDTFPGRVIRVVGTRRQAGVQTDFLRMLGATLLDFRVDIDMPGMQVQAKRVAHLVLGEQASELQPNTVSKIWKELREDLQRFPHKGTSLLDP